MDHNKAMYYVTGYNSTCGAVGFASAIVHPCASNVVGALHAYCLEAKEGFTTNLLVESSWAPVEDLPSLFATARAD